MRNGQVVMLDATQVTVTQADLGRGGQGAVHLVEPATAPELPGILKQLEPKPGVDERVHGLCDGNFSHVCIQPIDPENRAEPDWNLLEALSPAAS